MTFPSPRSPRILAVLGCLAILGLLWVESRPIQTDRPWRSELEAATNLSRQGADILGRARLARGASSEPPADRLQDPAQAGLIGTKDSPITSMPGRLDAKIASTSPHFAAVVVELLKQAGVERGDVVAVAATGSYPALNISALAAIEALGVEPLWITSIASSSWGANDPQATWLDHEKQLADSGLWTTRSLVASLGAGDDRGRGLGDSGRELARHAAQRQGVDLIETATLEESVAERLRVYHTARGSRVIRAYLNIGGGVASLGRLYPSASWPVGLVVAPPQADSVEVPGVASHFAQQGVPVIHLSNPPLLAERYGFHRAPVGHPGLYSVLHYDRQAAGTVFLVLAFVIGALTWNDRRRHDLLQHAPLEGAEAISSPSPAVGVRNAGELRPEAKAQPVTLIVLAAVFLGTVLFDAPTLQADDVSIPSLEAISVDLGSAARTYHLIRGSGGTTVRVSGPGDFEILTRALVPESCPSARYQFAYRLDRGDLQERRVEPTLLENTIVVPGGFKYRVSSLRKHVVQLGAGEHRLKIHHRPVGCSGALAVRLRQRSADRPQIPESSGLGWDMALRLEMAYDSNILRYSEKFIDRFDAGREPGRFRVDSLDDVTTGVRLRLDRPRIGWAGRPARFHARLDHRAYGRNSIKDWSRLEIGWRQDLPRDWRVTVAATALPNFYIRHQRDRDLNVETASAKGSGEAFYPLEFENYGVETLLEKRWTSEWRSGFEIRARETRYNEEFREFDSSSLRLGARLDRHLDRWRLRGRVRLTESTARGYDQPGETRSTSDDSDASYDEVAVLLSARWRGRSSPRVFLLEAERYDRQYTTSRPASASPIYAGREDERWRLRASYDWPLRETIGASAFLEYWQRRSRSAVSPLDLGREKDYEVVLTGLRLSWHRR